MFLGRFWHRQSNDEIAHLRASLDHADRMRDDAVQQCGVALDALNARDRDVARLQGQVNAGDTIIRAQCLKIAELTADVKARDTIILARDQRIAELTAERKATMRDGRGRFATSTRRSITSL
jgi:uncharacterized metal-binding protein YceD (DUF177 family)